MSVATHEQSTVIRTARGLTIAGTRITLYSIMDYLKAGWPPHLIQHWFDLSETQMADVLRYVAAHPNEVEAEYQAVVQQAEANRAYWESRNRERRQQIVRLPPKPGYEAVYAKLQAKKAELGIE